MADISKITTLDGSTYDLKDITARQTLPWAVVDSTSTATAYTATVPGITVLQSGVVCVIMNNKVTSKSGCTMNVNGLGAKPIYRTDVAATRVTTQFATNVTWLFIYNATRVSGGCWDLVYLYNTNTTYSTMLNTHLGYNLTKAGTNGYKMYSLLMQESSGRLTSLTTNSGNGTSKTPSSVGFILGDIFYHNNTADTAAGAGVTNVYLYDTYALDFRYSSNCGTTLSTDAMVYLVGTVHSDGLWYPDPTWWTQTLPTSEDGKVYILVGLATSTSVVGLARWNPAYIYKDGALRSYAQYAELSGNASKVNGHTVASDVPANAKFTDTTYNLVTASTSGLMSAADKLKLDSIITSNANSPILVVETSAFSSLPVTISSDKITENHYLLESTLSNPAAQSGDWTITTTNGSLTISGNVSGSTTARLMLGRVDEQSATIMVFDIPAFSSLPVTVTDSRITAYHYVLHTELGTPSAQTGDWTVTTGTGSMSVSGSISGQTTLRVILGTAGSL